VRNTSEAILLGEVGRLDFRTSRSGETATASIQRTLGLQYRYQPARLAIARSLAIGTEPQSVTNHDGKVIRGETLFGPGADELAVWFGLILAAAPTRPISRRELQDLVAAHWARGAGLMWEQLRDEVEPLEVLARQIGARASGSRQRARR